MKYTEEQKQQIYNLSSNGWSGRQIAKYLGISKSGVNDFLNSGYLGNETKPKILFLDFETAAALVHCFGRHKQFINQDAVVKEGGWILMGGYNRWKEDEESKVVFDSESIVKGDDFAVCSFFWNLLQDCNVIIGHNVKQFDLKVLETRCLANGLPPLPFVQVS